MKFVKNTFIIITIIITIFDHLLCYSALTSGKTLLLMPSLPLRYIFYCMSLLSTFIEKYTYSFANIFYKMIQFQCNWNVPFDDRNAEIVGVCWNTKFRVKKQSVLFLKGEKITISGCIWYVFPSPLPWMMFMLQNVVNH